MEAFDAAWSILKARSYHRQRVVPNAFDAKGNEMAGGKPMRLQQWANKHPSTKAMEGDARVPHRDQLMRDAVSNPQKHGLVLLDNIPHPDDVEGSESMEDAMSEGAKGGQPTLMDF